MEPNNVTQSEQNSAPHPTITGNTTAPVQQMSVAVKRKSSGKKILITCIGILILLLLCGSICCGGSLLLTNALFGSAKSSIVSTICEDDASKWERIYFERTTEAYRKEVTLETFTAYLNTVSASACDDIKDISLFNFPTYINSGLEYYTSIENGDGITKISGEISGVKIDMELIQKSGSNDLKINKFTAVPLSS